MTGFDNGLVLLRSVKTISVVMFCVRDIGMLVNRCVPPVLLMAIEDRFTYGVYNIDQGSANACFTNTHGQT